MSALPETDPFVCILVAAPPSTRDDVAVILHDSPPDILWPKDLLVSHRADFWPDLYTGHATKMRGPAAVLPAGIAPAAFGVVSAAGLDRQEIVKEARAEGFEPPAEVALQNATRIVSLLHVVRPEDVEVYPTEDREVAIAIPGARRRRSMLVLCGSDGGALCSVNLDGVHRRAVYDSAVTLPDGFMREALVDVGAR